MEKEQGNSFHNFVIVWFGQFISILGSGLSAFGLSMWIYYSTGAATPFALSFLCSMLPMIIFAPMAGSFADRKNRKFIIMITDYLDACLKILMAILLLTGVMRVWMVYPILFLSETLATFQSPAFSASIPMLVDERKISKANGMLQLTQAAQNMIAPVLAGALYVFIGLEGLLAIDFISFAFAIITMAITKIPQEKLSDDQDTRLDFKVIASDFKSACLYISKIPSLLQAVAIFSFLNFVANICLVLLGPMVLSNYSSTIYGGIQTAYGMAMLVGGIIASALPDVKNKFRTMFFVLMLSGVGLIIAGANAHWIVIGIGMFVFYLLVPYANTLFSTVFQTITDQTALGRVTACVSALLKIVSPVACVIAGPLSDYCFEPLMREDGILGKSFAGTLFGTGTGRGDGLIFVVCGIVLFLICCIAWLNAKPLNSKS